MRLYPIIMAFTFFLLLTPQTFASNITAAQSDLYNHTAAYFKFDNGLLTNSIAGGNSFVNTDATVTTQGKIREAYNLTGSNTPMRLTDYNGIRPNTRSDWTINFWLNDADVATHYFMSKVGALGRVEFYFSGGTLTTQVQCGAGTTLNANVANFFVNPAHKNKYTMLTFVYDGNTTADDSMRVYINGTLATTGTAAVSDCIIGDEWEVGKVAGFNPYFAVDEWMVYNGTMAPWTITELYRSTGWQYPYSSNLTISAFNLSGNGILMNFSAFVNDTYFNTNTGVITTQLSYTDNHILTNVTIFNVTIPPYYNQTYLNFNASSQYLLANLTPFFINVTPTWSNYIVNGSTNWTNTTINYTLTYTCPSFIPTNITLYANGTYNDSFAANCTNTTGMTYGGYHHYRQGNISMALYFNSSLGAEYNQLTKYFQAAYDYEAPVVNVTLNITNAFGNRNITSTINCTDTMDTRLRYNLTFNALLIFLNDSHNGTLITNSTQSMDGINVLIGTCGDIFYNTTENTSLTTYSKILALIDERNNVDFVVSNISVARVYTDDNSSFYDFKTNNTARVNFTTSTLTSLRFELGYITGDIITKYIDVSLVNESTVRVCANPDDVVNYIQLIISSQTRAAAMKSVFAECYVAADYTRFAFQDNKVLKAYTIQTLYYLYTYSAGQKVYLASVDGSLADYINLDAIEFRNEGFNINTIDDVLVTSQATNTSAYIYYYDPKDDNLQANMTVTLMDNNTVVFSLEEFSQPNNITVLFDWSTLNVSNSTVFQVTVDANSGGDIDSITRYFNIQGKVNILKAKLAFIIALLLTLFGLTFTATRITFSWFGIVTLLASILVLSLAIQTFAVQMLMAIDVICMVYVVLIMVSTNYPTVS